MVCKSISRELTVYLKAIAILFVVFGHIGIIPTGGAVGVEMFLVLSGYGIHQSYLRKGLKNFWKNKLDKIWLPFMMWELIITSFFIITKSNTSFNSSSIVEIFTSIIGVNTYNVLDKTMWYIPYLFIEYFLFWVIYRYGNKIKSFILFLSLTFVVSCIAYKGLFPRYTGLWIYTLGFPIGVFYSQYLDKLKWHNAFCIIAFGLLLWPVATKHVILYFLFVTIIGLMTIAIPNIVEQIPELKALKYIGENSFYIYLFEAVVINICGYYLTSKINRITLNLIIMVDILMLCIMRNAVRKLYNARNGTR